MCGRVFDPEEVSETKLNPLKGRKGDRWLWTLARRYNVPPTMPFLRDAASNTAAVFNCPFAVFPLAIVEGAGKAEPAFFEFDFGGGIAQRQRR